MCDIAVQVSSKGPSMHSSRLRRAAPLGAVALAISAIAAPGAQGAGVVAPGGEIHYNDASVTLSNFPNAATPVTVTRDGVTIGTAVANVGAPLGTPGVATLNVPGLVGPGHVLDCWTKFTPDILPGDVITIGGAAALSITAPDFSISAPTQVGGDIIARGSAATATGGPAASIQAALFSPLSRFSAAAKGNKLLVGALSFDAAGGTAVTARYPGLTPLDLAIGMGATSQLVTLPPPGGIGGLSIGVENPAVPGPVPGCAAPLGSDGVTGANNPTVNIANAGTALVLTGTADPNVTGVTVAIGGSTVPAALAGGTWSATVNAANMPDGKLVAAPRFTAAGGAYHGRNMTIVKDTVAPAAVTAGVASGTYPSARSVSLSGEAGSAVYYTTNGSDPSTSSTKYSGAINVAQTQSIKAIAVDAAGNAGPIAQFDYTISPPIVVQAPVQQPVVTVGPKLKLDSLTLTRKAGLRSVKRSGISAVIYAPEGAKIAKIRVLRGKTVIETITRKVSRDGIVEVRLPSSAKVRRSLKRGTYTMQFQVGQSASNLGSIMTRLVKIA
jgi:hypothetical protein